MSDSRDYLLTNEQYRRVRAEAQRALKKADAFGCFPTPVEAIMEAAQVQEIEDEVLNEGFLKRMRRQAGKALRSGLKKVIGLYDAVSQLVIVDRTIHFAKQVFVRLHEVGHSVMPWQRDLYHIVETSDQCIQPDTAELFDREANVFAKEVLFQNDGFALDAANRDFELDTAVELSQKYGASIHSSIWEFAASNPRACVVIVTSKPVFAEGIGFRARRQQVIPSQSFAEQFGQLRWPRVFTPDDSIGALLPVGPCEGSDKIKISLQDDNGDEFECIAESFSNTYNVFVLIYPIRALTKTVTIRTATR